MSTGDRKHFIILSPGFPADESDTSCLPAIQNFIHSLNRVFPHLAVTVIALEYPYTTTTYKWFGNKVIPLHAKKSASVFRYLFLLKAFRILKNITTEHDVLGILSLWCLQTALIGKVFSRRKKLKHHVWLQGQDARAGNPYIALVRPQATELIAMSDALSGEFEKNYGIKPAHTIYNGVNTALYTRGNHDRHIDLLGVGSLIQLKRYDIFIAVVKTMIKVKPDLRAGLAGSGPQDEHLKKMLAAEGLAENVVMYGELPNKEVIGLMQHTRIFLHPSSYEGYSTVCLEALAAGCHVISFVRCEPGEIAHWHIVENTEAMARRCQDLLQRPADHTPVVARDMDDSAREMMRLYGLEITS